MSTFRKIVTAIIVVPLVVIIVAFAVANRQAVTVSFDPLGFDRSGLRGDVAAVRVHLRRADPRRADRRLRRLAAPGQMARRCAPARCRPARIATTTHALASRRIRRRRSRRPRQAGTSPPLAIPPPVRLTRLCGGAEKRVEPRPCHCRSKSAVLKTAEALDVALESGADRVGFVFFPPSPRNLGLEAARALGARVRAAPAKWRSPSMPTTRCWQRSSPR